MILGMAHFIKTAEDLYEAIVNSVPNAKFGLGFCEASDTAWFATKETTRN
jgi:adenosine/AMP kinase